MLNEDLQKLKYDNIKIEREQRDSTAGEVLALHSAHLGSISVLHLEGICKYRTWRPGVRAELY